MMVVGLRGLSSIVACVLIVHTLPAVFALPTESPVHTASDGMSVVSDDLHQFVPPFDSRSEQHAIPTDQIGEPHGKSFTDVSAVSEHHRRIATITLNGCGPGQRLTQIMMGYRDNHGLADAPDHFTVHGLAIAGHEWRSLALEKDEYVTDVYLSTYREKVGTTIFAPRRTRIGYAMFETNKGHSVKCGSNPVVDNTYWWRQPNPKMVLLYLSGSSGDAIDALTGHFIPVGEF